MAKKTAKKEKKIFLAVWQDATFDWYTFFTNKRAAIAFNKHGLDLQIKSAKSLGEPMTKDEIKNAKSEFEVREVTLEFMKDYKDATIYKSAKEAIEDGADEL